jgi:hypothetical protein
MRKLLVVGAVAIIALLVLMWHEMHGQVDAAPAVAPRAANPTPSAPTAQTQAAQALAKAAEAAATPPDGKVSVNSDDFFNHFIERGPRVVSREAMSCYHGGLNRRGADDSLTISFVESIKDGEVTVIEAKAEKSRLGDKALEDCMLAAVRKAHWHDDSLPDVDRYEDSTTLTPERGGKKYIQSDHEGPLAPPNTPR